MNSVAISVLNQYSLWDEPSEGCNSILLGTSYANHKHYAETKKKGQFACLTISSLKQLPDMIFSGDIDLGIDEE